MGVHDDGIVSEVESNTILAFIENCKNKDLNLNCKLNSYLYSIARNHVRKYFENAYNKKRKTLDASLKDIGYTPVYDFELDYKTFLFREAIKELSEKDQKIMNLLIGGYSTKEIIELTDLSNKYSVKTKKYKLLKKVREILGVKKPTKKVSS